MVGTIVVVEGVEVVLVVDVTGTAVVEGADVEGADVEVSRSFVVAGAPSAFAGMVSGNVAADVVVYSDDSDGNPPSSAVWAEPPQP